MEKKVQFSIRLSKSLIEQIDKLADNNNRNRSNMIETMLVHEINSPPHLRLDQLNMDLMK